ncbi:acylphosphatase [Robertmurraya yapensis]|uniref:acylphosphatase n=2 Tax=Bacillaceae TaxID=186817 RepID=A0A3S0KJ12_9BACI|nr:acylphosphatase [Bacillus yapensis]RTR31983.1 acylphosphatase [Bacillus yapensis]TKS95997.1 acylphosphatase [Bacillus yapensis]
MVRLHITVSGVVQGVGFRYFTQMKAVQFNINGWVRNSTDGEAVEIVAVGDRDNLDQFIKSLRQGNPFSKVTDINMNELTDTEPFHSFKIRY